MVHKPLKTVQQPPSSYLTCNYESKMLTNYGVYAKVIQAVPCNQDRWNENIHTQKFGIPLKLLLLALVSCKHKCEKKMICKTLRRSKLLEDLGREVRHDFLCLNKVWEIIDNWFLTLTEI